MSEDAATGEAIRRTMSGSYAGQPANMVDALFAVAAALERVARAIEKRPQPPISVGYK